MTAAYFCPHYQANQPGYEFREHGELNVKGFQAGATLAMQKRFEPQKLLSTIKTALALKAKRPSR